MGFYQKLTELSWLETGEPVEDQFLWTGSAKRTALTVFLAVVTSIFFLLVMAYIQRMELSDWNPLTEPRLLWVNTVFLVIGSIAMQTARQSAVAGKRSVTAPLLAGGLLVVAFLIGQWVAWQRLKAGGFYLSSNPANAFFYLLTGLHGLHLIGGLFVWMRTMMRSLRGVDVEEIRLSVELCSVYWHYLLLVWLVVFALMLNT